MTGWIVCGVLGAAFLVMSRAELRRARRIPRPDLSMQPRYRQLIGEPLGPWDPWEEFDRTAPIR